MHKMAQRIHVTVNNDKLKILRSIKGLGEKDAERIDNALTSFLAQNGHYTKK